MSLGGIEGAPVADGRFPVALFSHGFSGFNTQSSELTSHVASWGFVVAAPEHQSRDLTSQIGMLFGAAKPYGPHPDVADLRATIDLLTELRRLGQGQRHRRRLAQGPRHDRRRAA